ncbi:alpha/beta hydrolase [Roseovarius salinarum]|uniref:alpha/beta hydrolase n=1 Tax=Roseovarius salinarum TaxID=1981892 RepID=UPI000C331CEF|nr:alpha/beta hydrolase [Roseovarius salinarum]
MPVLRINAGKDALEAHGQPGPVDPLLRKALRGTGPIVVMVHGYKFAPGHAGACPHDHILSLDPPGTCWKALSWPRQLGFGTDRGDEGLAIAFGWRARGSIWRAYREAEIAGHALARLVEALGRLAPHRPVHALAHSLGARVVLSALPQLSAGRLGRVILLAGAEYSTRAAAALDSPAGRAAEIFNVTSRENDLFDFLLERLIAPPRRGDWALGQLMPARPNTLTVQMDHPATLQALRAAGFAIAPTAARVCHWSGYLRPGVFDFYRALLREPARLPLRPLRAALPDRPDPRWSRILAAPALHPPLPSGRRASS